MNKSMENQMDINVKPEGTLKESTSPIDLVKQYPVKGEGVVRVTPKPWQVPQTSNLVL